jgi:hypothetical protein
MSHHLQTLLVIVRSIRRITIHRFARAILLPSSMRTIDSHKTLALRFEHIESRVFVPAVDEITVQAVATTDLR